MEGEKLEISERSEGFGVEHACDFFGGCFVLAFSNASFWSADRWGRTRRFHHVGPILVPLPTTEPHQPREFMLGPLKETVRWMKWFSDGVSW